MFTIAWVVWIVAFLVIEGIALARKEKGDTLSEHVWVLLKKTPLLWWVAAGFLLWLVGHFLVPTFGGF